MKVKSYVQAYISENVTCNIFDKKMKLKRKLSTKHTRAGLESSSIIIIPLQYLHKCV